MLDIQGSRARPLTPNVRFFLVTGEALISAEIHQFFIEEFRYEVSQGFPRLKRIPGTSVQGFLLYFSELNPMDQHALIEVLTRRSMYLFFPQDAASIYSETDGNLHYQRYRAILLYVE